MKSLGFTLVSEAGQSHILCKNLLDFCCSLVPPTSVSISVVSLNLFHDGPSFPSSLLQLPPN